MWGRNVVWCEETSRWYAVDATTVIGATKRHSPLLNSMSTEYLKTSWVCTVSQFRNRSLLVALCFPGHKFQSHAPYVFITHDAPCVWKVWDWVNYFGWHHSYWWKVFHNWNIQHCGVNEWNANPGYIVSRKVKFEILQPCSNISQQISILIFQMKKYSRSSSCSGKRLINQVLVPICQN